MSHFSNHKAKLSRAALSRRNTAVTAFAGLILFLYALLPRPTFDSGTASLHGFQRVDLPTQPIAQKIEEMHSGLSESSLRDDTLADERRIGTSGEASGQMAGCLRSVIYDKPVKTGSTAISFAISDYLKSIGRPHIPCSHKQDSCLLQAGRVCLGTHKRQAELPSFLGHLKQSNGSTIECLKRMGYYAVTSIRDPYQRRKSAYLFNRTLKGNHYGIPYTASFKEFMKLLPRCIMLNDLDGLGKRCDDSEISVEERIQRIVERYDEVIELGEEPRGGLYSKIFGYIERENVSHKADDVGEFDEETLREERMLYNALKEKMLRAEFTDRVIC